MMRARPRRDRPPEIRPLDIPLRCRCGQVRGIATDVSASNGYRFICYCKDCQAFARFLERPDVLDPAGGTDIFQMPPARLKIIDGMEALRCLRLSEKVLRWYAGCCRTPIANTAADPRFPVAAVIHSFMHHEADQSRTAVLGPPLCRIFERSALGPLPSNAPRAPSFWLLARRSTKLFTWWVRGLAQPTPFFDDRTKAPRAVPRTFAENAASPHARSLRLSVAAHKLADDKSKLPASTYGARTRWSSRRIASPRAMDKPLARTPLRRGRRASYV